MLRCSVDSSKVDIFNDLQAHYLPRHAGKSISVIHLLHDIIRYVKTQGGRSCR